MKRRRSRRPWTPSPAELERLKLEWQAEAQRIKQPSTVDSVCPRCTTVFRLTVLQAEMKAYVEGGNIRTGPDETERYTPPFCPACRALAFARDPGAGAPGADPAGVGA